MITTRTMLSTVLGVAALVSATLFGLSACGGGDASTMPGTLPANAIPPAVGFALMDEGDNSTTLDIFLGKSTVDGIAIRTSWSTLEPSKGNYDWTTIETALSLAATHKKKVTIHVMASVYGSPPDWVYTEGASKYSYIAPDGITTQTDPVPWDSTFLSEWKTFVDELASYLNQNNRIANVAYISIAVPVPEMSLFGCTDGLLGVDKLLGNNAVTYSRAAYQDAWKTSIQDMHSTFPNVIKLLPAPVSMICKSDNDGPVFYDDLLNSLTPSTDGYAIYATDLNANGSQRMAGLLSGDAKRAPVAFQFISAMQGSLKSAVCSGLRTYGATYFEIYKSDLQSTDTNIEMGVQAIHSPELCG